jgi:hypothetical protein
MVMEPIRVARLVDSGIRHPCVVLAESGTRRAVCFPTGVTCNPARRTSFAINRTNLTQIKALHIRGFVL